MVDGVILQCHYNGQTPSMMVSSSPASDLDSSMGDSNTKESLHNDRTHYNFAP